MSITIKSNTDTILELPGLTGTLGPGKAAVVQAMTPDLLRAVDLGLLLVPSGTEPPEGLPPVVFDHRYPHVLPLTAGRAYYVRVLRSPGGFHDGTRVRDFIAYYGDGAGMSCAFSDDGFAWDAEKKVTGIAANGYHVVCALEAADRLRILYWNPDVPNQPYAMAGLRTAVCDPSVAPAAFTGDTPCSRTAAGRSSSAATRRAWSGTPTAHCSFTARPRTRPPTGPSFPVCGHRPSDGGTCSARTGSARVSLRGKLSGVASAPRPSATQPYLLHPWATSGSTPTSRAAESGRNTQGPTGSGAKN